MAFRLSRILFVSCMWHTSLYTVKPQDKVLWTDFYIEEEPQTLMIILNCISVVVSFPKQPRAARNGLAVDRFACPRGLYGNLQSEISHQLCHSRTLADLKVVKYDAECHSKTHGERFDYSATSSQPQMSRLQNLQLRSSMSNGLI